MRVVSQGTGSHGIWPGSLGCRWGHDYCPYSCISFDSECGNLKMPVTSHGLVTVWVQLLPDTLGTHEHLKLLVVIVFKLQERIMNLILWSIMHGDSLSSCPRRKLLVVHTASGCGSNLLSPSRSQWSFLQDTSRWRSQASRGRHVRLYLYAYRSSVVLLYSTLQFTFLELDHSW